MSDERGSKNLRVLVGRHKPAFYYEKTRERIENNGVVEKVEFLARGRNISNAVIAAQMCCRYLEYRMEDIKVWDERINLTEGRKAVRTCISVTINKAHKEVAEE